jgi:hypothetical protein
MKEWERKERRMTSSRESDWLGQDGKRRMKTEAIGHLVVLLTVVDCATWVHAGLLAAAAR